jgi:hypothetical protein
MSRARRIVVVLGLPVRKGIEHEDDNGKGRDFPDRPRPRSAGGESKKAIENDGTTMITGRELNPEYSRRLPLIFLRSANQA